MSYKLICLLLLFSSFSFSQNKNSEATYRFYIQEEENDKMTNERKQEQKVVERLAKKIALKLIFNDTISMYFVDHGVMDPNEFNYSNALIYSKARSPIFINSNKKTISYNNYEILMYKKNEFLITDSIPKWKLSTETKKINNYTCYKATYEKEYQFYSDIVLKTITAWYCPEFPYPYGPKGFGGLPGLIFEVQDDKTVIGIESIVLNTNSKEIILPTKGKVIKEIDYYLKLHNSVNAYIESLKNKNKN